MHNLGWCLVYVSHEMLRLVLSSRWTFFEYSPPRKQSWPSVTYFEMVGQYAEGILIPYSNTFRMQLWGRLICPRTCISWRDQTRAQALRLHLNSTIDTRALWHTNPYCRSRACVDGQDCSCDPPGMIARQECDRAGCIPAVAFCT